MINHFTVCSVATNNYLHYALAFYTSLQRSNPGVAFTLFTLGDIHASDSLYLKNQCPSLTIVRIEEILSPTSFARYVANYTPFEVSCAVRGICHQFINDTTSYEAWLMLDLDTAIVYSLESTIAILENTSIFLTAHCSLPVALDDAIPFEKNLLVNGLYNGGVVGFRRSNETTLALSWLASRLEHYSESSRARIAEGLDRKDDCFFVDQLWLNLLPLYFSSSTYISSDPCHNLGHWNLWQGKLTRGTTNHEYFFDERNVVILHFSGLPKDNLEFVTIHTSLYADQPCVAWGDASRIFMQDLEKAKSLLTFSQYSYVNISPKRKPTILERVKQKLLGSLN